MFVLSLHNAPLPNSYKTLTMLQYRPQLKHWKAHCKIKNNLKPNLTEFFVETKTR